MDELYGVPTHALLPNATRHEIRASYEGLAIRQSAWMLWSVFSAINSVGCWIVPLAILTSRRARVSSTNIYVIALCLPDALVGVAFTVNNVVNFREGWYTSRALCDFQAFYLIFTIGCSHYINALIALEVYRLLKITRDMGNYVQPSGWLVACRCLAAYVWSAFVALWPLFGFLPHRIFLLKGLVCLPSEYNVGSAFFYYLVFFPAISSAPLGVALFIGYRVHRQKLLDLKQLLPRKSQTTSVSLPEDAQRRKAQTARSIAIFFSRIFVTLLVWQFGAALALLDTYSSAPIIISLVWGLSQPILTVAVSLAKPDIRMAVMNLISCRRFLGIGRVVPSLVKAQSAGAVDEASQLSYR